MGWITSTVAKVTGASWFIWIKLAAVGVIVAGACWVTWKVQGAYAKEHEERAVNAAVEQIQKDLDAERTNRKFYQALADEKLADLLKSITKLRIDQAKIGRDLAEARKESPEFYDQPLPPKGYEAWKRARELAGASPAASSPP